ncbi:IclR family transcriptional regulator [Micromonospora echinofusca]|uniref:Helix-turn-helix domain-containing protein n=1 Tax=Micromonospora echinofusca TaxID=47858 RepID=A0ABS3VTS5_MICEH|nr:IclR family transcriptional regulator [Micromonospora echinofusca]MBO4207952.1 helix-turn-helix domain-containing protein [Micromonospora echinofusca]
MTTKERRTDEVAVLVKALDILDRMALDAPCTVVSLCEHTGVTKPAAYRIMKTLEQRGYVVRDDATREYSLGPALYGLSRAVRTTTDLVGLAQPAMRRLHEEFGETVNLGVVSHGQVVYLDTIESTQRLRSTVQIALRDPVHSTALGKAVLAALPEAQARAHLNREDLTRLTPNTIVTVDAVMDELATYRSTGYAVDDEENELGSRCVAAPILDRYDRPIASISISAPTTRMTDSQVGLVGRRLVEVCRELSDTMV